MNYTQSKPIYRLPRKSLHIDWPLLGLLGVIVGFGLLVLYSASNENMGMLLRQIMRLGLAFTIMMFFAMIPPHKYKAWTPWAYFGGLLLLVAVVLIGKIGKGAQRWLDFGLFRFQPSEIMKLAVPMMAAWYFDRTTTPMRFKDLIKTGLIILVPTILIAKQPDLGTAIMVMGILPVVGIPLPLISYGGTAMVTFLAGFGILMSISTHRILFTTFR